jgi:hypothetical protein
MAPQTMLFSTPMIAAMRAEAGAATSRLRRRLPMDVAADTSFASINSVISNQDNNTQQEYFMEATHTATLLNAA